MKSHSPQQLALDGKHAYQQQNYQAAARAFAAAAEVYSSEGDTLNAAEMANNQCVALLQAKDARRALQAVEGTDITFATAGDERRQAMALANRGTALEALGDFEAAILSYEQAAEIFKKIGEHELRAPLMQSLATLQLRTGNHLQGLATMQYGLEEMEKPSSQQNFLKNLLAMLLRRLGF